MNKKLPESMGYNVEEVSLRKTLIVILITVVLICILIFLSREYFIKTTEEIVYENILKPESKKLLETRAYEAEMLTRFTIVDSEKNIYRIPVENAKEILVMEYHNRPWASK